MISCNLSRATVSFALTSLLLAVVFHHAAANSTEDNCSRQCRAENCDNVGIRYGKYCGIGYWGCAGEKACDGLDACCMAHDDCVGRFGMTHVKCHKKLRNCLAREQKSGRVGFSKECPYNRAAPTMINAMDLAILLSQLGDSTSPSPTKSPKP